MVNVVARVEDPYGRHREQSNMPLAVGLFVEAEIEGRTARDVYVLPRTALRPGDPMDPSAPDSVHVVDAEGRLEIRPVEVLRSERTRVLIGSGLTPGERVSVSPMQAVVDGMTVRTVGPETPS
jgi:multidrug efflux pump subunit AcrA (membrane-fusion protein)